MSEELATVATEVEGIGAELEQTTEAEVQEQESIESTVEAEPQSAAQVWKQVKEKLSDSPHIYNQVKNALHAFEKQGKYFPDGIEKTSERLKLLQQLDDDPEDQDYVPGSAPFETVISNAIAERSFWRDFDSAFQAGDGRVINQMIEANPESFQRLIPEAMDHYADMNPEAYTAYICRSVDGFIAKSEIPKALMRLDLILPKQVDDRPENANLKAVVESFQEIKALFDYFGQKAQGKIEPKAVESTQRTVSPDNNLDDRETVVRNNEWVLESRPKMEEFAAKEALKHAGKHRFTSAEVSSIQNFVRDEVKARTSGDQGYQKTIRGFLKANNKASFQMAVRSKHEGIIGGPNGAAKRAVDHVLSQRKVAPKVQPQVRQAVQQNGEFEPIAGSPAAMKLTVDWSKTSKKMYQNNQAFIKGRTKPVQWRA